ncbi:FGGY carbohydrate kinase domain-containing protein isoform X2 [Bacillus rossius redtenbacheri]|uniref:FGGY carbohydrate kinase domain-containing protein isoform X2 n=1 Tax=Bacillus rossius redtenbacheri TaxID=93214 RepID=UPI002FDF02F6
MTKETNETPSKTTYFVGVDVGTGSVRAALVDNRGKFHKTSTKDTKTWTPKAGYYEQSTDDIWSACCSVVKDVTEGVPAADVKGVGFDATCSLVAVDKDGKPLTISPTGENARNVMLWLDHRAIEEASFINGLGHPVLKYVGGTISLEMETPKLLWLKKNLRKECWDRAGWFFDLPDFLTWRATGADSRSLCSLVCKWTYVAGAEGAEAAGWSLDFFTQAGLAELAEGGWRKIGAEVKEPGAPCGAGLSERAAGELGLLAGTPVGTSMIDAHAGALGLLGCSAPGVPRDFHTRLGLVCGTSTCHMAVSRDPLFVRGVWGPYRSALVPGYWLNEGGQSATGKLVDHVIETHPAASSARAKAGGRHIQEYLLDLLKEMAERQNLPCVAMLTKDVHVWPDFHGNRSPLADPSLQGMICGLTLSADEENLAVVYLATIQALATQADAAGLPVLCPCQPESVLLGAAILGACAAGTHSSVPAAVQAMGGPAAVVRPRELDRSYHEKKYKVFLRMVEHQKEYRNIMSDFIVLK